MWLGATLAMVLADGLAIAAGALLHRRLPERLLHTMASVLFLLFGVWLLFDGGSPGGWRQVAVIAIASVGLLAAGIASSVPAARPGCRAPGRELNPLAPVVPTALQQRWAGLASAEACRLLSKIGTSVAVHNRWRKPRRGAT